jgi:Ca-activated chloride channel family protein
MKWTQPEYLILLSIVPLVVVLTLVTERYLQRVRTVWSGQGTRLHWRSRLRIAMVILIFAALPLALAGLSIQMMAPRSGHDRVTLIVGLDVSKSMLAEDVFATSDSQDITNRLNLGRTFIGELLNELDGEQVGLFFFARNGIEVVPPTSDHGFIRYILRHTDLSGLTDSGSDLLAAVATGETMLARNTAGDTEAIILVSDGEDSENSPEQFSRQLHEFSVTPKPIYSVRVGGDEAVLIPIRKTGIAGIDGFYRDEQGSYLQTQSSDQMLQQLASATQGATWHYRSDSHGLVQQIVAQIFQQAEQRVPLKANTQKWFDLSGLILSLTAILYCVYMIT